MFLQFVLFFMSCLSERLVALRGNEAQGVFAARLGLKQAVYCHYEKGRREPSLDQLVHIAQVLGTTPNDLLGVSSSSVDERERVGAESRGSGAVMPASGCRDSRQSRSPQAPGELPQCARCPHRKLADKMRKMIGEG